MAYQKRSRCMACGEVGSTHRHRCPPVIDREDWADIRGDQCRFVAFPCVYCGAKISTDPVNPAAEPATSYGVAWAECEHCGKTQQVRFAKWPCRPLRPVQSHKSRYGRTYGT